MSRSRSEPKILELRSKVKSNECRSLFKGTFQSPDIENLVFGRDAAFGNPLHILYPSFHDGLRAVIFRERRSYGVLIQSLGVWADFVKPFFHNGPRGIVPGRERTTGHGS